MTLPALSEDLHLDIVSGSITFKGTLLLASRLSRSRGLTERSNTRHEQHSLLAYTPASPSSRSSNLLTLRFRLRSLCCRCACPWLFETLVSLLASWAYFSLLSTGVPRISASTQTEKAGILYAPVIGLIINQQLRCCCAGFIFV